MILCVKHLPFCVAGNSAQLADAPEVIGGIGSEVAGAKSEMFPDPPLAGIAAPESAEATTFVSVKGMVVFEGKVAT